MLCKSGPCPQLLSWDREGSREGDKHPNAPLSISLFLFSPSLVTLWVRDGWWASRWSCVQLPPSLPTISASGAFIGWLRIFQCGGLFVSHCPPSFPLRPPVCILLWPSPLNHSRYLCCAGVSVGIAVWAYIVYQLVRWVYMPQWALHMLTAYTWPQQRGCGSTAGGHGFNSHSYHETFAVFSFMDVGFCNPSHSHHVRWVYMLQWPLHMLTACTWPKQAGCDSTPGGQGFKSHSCRKILMQHPRFYVWSFVTHHAVIMHSHHIWDSTLRTNLSPHSAFAVYQRGTTANPQPLTVVPLTWCRVFSQRDYGGRLRDWAV
jgi:hypothetical protein